ncbi:MAG: glycosyltransferase family 4 protein, partial [Geobacteraceae bacterium]|nr:glycosyltransferase family 4 protein [Geobacteraceae bacterium]
MNASPSDQTVKACRMRTGSKPLDTKVLIACTHFWPSIGGVETIAENLGVRLAEFGYQIDVATWAFPGRAADTLRGLRIISLNTAHHRNGISEWIYELRDLVTSGIYDACILLADPQNLVIWSIENANIPSQTKIIIQPLINEEGYANWKANSEFRRRLAAILKNADAVIALSRNGAEMRYFNDEGITSVYLPNATSLEQHANDFRSHYGIPDETPLFIHVANLWPVKNHDGLLRTLRDMPGDWRLAMIGHPSDNMEYVKLVRQEASLDSRVILIPGLSR